MTNNEITIQTILESAEKYGKENILTWNPAEKKKKTSTSKFDCNWLSLKLKLADGTERTPYNVKFIKVISSSCAKLPPNTEKDKAKHLQITFAKMSIKDIMVGDWAPKIKLTPEEQEREDKAALDLATSIKKNTDDFNDALEALSLSYQRIAKEIKESEELEFNVNKNTATLRDIKKEIKDTYKRAATNAELNKPVRVNLFRQISYENKETDETVYLAEPLSRIRLDLLDRKLVSREFDGKTPITGPNVYTVRSSATNSQFKLATVKENGKHVGLNIDNAAEFLTRGSLINGYFKIGQISISSLGISLPLNFGKIYVKSQRANKHEVICTIDELSDLIGSGESDDDDDKEYKTGKKITTKDEDSDSDLEDKEDESEDEKPVIKVKKESKSKSKPAKKISEKKPVKKEAKPSKKKAIIVKKEDSDVDSASETESVKKEEIDVKKEEPLVKVEAIVKEEADDEDGEDSNDEVISEDD